MIDIGVLVPSSVAFGDTFSHKGEKVCRVPSHVAGIESRSSIQLWREPAQVYGPRTDSDEDKAEVLDKMRRPNTAALKYAAQQEGSRQR